MSAYFKNLHPYVAQRIVRYMVAAVRVLSDLVLGSISCSLFGLLLKKHNRLIELIRQRAVPDETEQTTEELRTDEGESVSFSIFNLFAFCNSYCFFI